jgi:O-antigen/teichoic acid export membrane protein
MSLTQYITRNFLARGLFALSNILVTILLARVLGPAESGRLFYLLNNFAIAVLAGSFCLETGLTYYVSKKEIAPERFPALILVWSFIAGLLGYLIFHWVFDLPNSDPWNAGHAAYAWIFITGTLITTYYTALFYAQKQFLFPLLLPAGTNLLLMALYFLSVSFSSQGIQHLLLPAYISLAIINGIGSAVLFHRYYKIPLTFILPEKESLRKIWTFSKLALLTNILSFFALRIDYWILDAYSGRSVTPDALGNYIQVSKMYQAFLLMPTILATVIFPVTASGDTVNMRKKVWVLFRWVLAGTAAVVLLLGSTGHWLFPLVFGERYIDMYSCYLASMAGIISLSLISILAAYFSGNNQLKYNLVGSLLAFGLVTLFNFILVPQMGINGAAWADSIGYFGYLCFLVYFFWKKTTPTP